MVLVDSFITISAFCLQDLACLYVAMECQHGAIIVVAFVPRIPG